MKKILIADDSWIARRSISNFISSEEWNILEAENGTQALEKIDSESPDAVLLDLLMPEPGGVEVLRKLSEQKSHPPVIVMTADIQETTKKRCFDLGASNFLKKPPRREEVVEAIKEVL